MRTNTRDAKASLGGGGTPTNASAAMVAHRLLSSMRSIYDNDWPVHSLMFSLFGLGYTILLCNDSHLLFRVI